MTAKTDVVSAVPCDMPNHVRRGVVLTGMKCPYCEHDRYSAVAVGSVETQYALPAVICPDCLCDSPNVCANCDRVGILMELEPLEEA